MGLKIWISVLVALIGIFLITTLIPAPPITGITINQTCQEIACQGSADPCFCDNITINDNERIRLLSSGSTPVNLTANFSSVDIPNGSNIIKSWITINWTDEVGSCSIEVYNGTWNTVTSICPGAAFQTDYFNITNIVKNKTFSENISIWINYTHVAGSLYINYISINVTYAPPFRYENWNLINSSGEVAVDGENFSRGGYVNATANWSNDIFTAFVEHNGTGSLVNYSFGGPFTGNWTNYTLNFSNYTEFPIAGNISVRIVGNDTFGQENFTLPARYVNLWGTAGVAGLSFSQGQIINWTNSSVICNVTDSDSGAGIPGYNVSFWNNGSYMGLNATGSNGLARYLYMDATNLTGSSLEIPFSCNITVQNSIFYNLTAGNNASANLTVTNVGIVNTTHSVYNRGENVTIQYLDTLDQSIPDVMWNVSLIKYNQSTAVSMFNGTAENVSVIYVETNDTVGNYTLFYNATAPGRSRINGTVEYDVSDSLVANFSQPSNGSSFGASANIDVTIKVLKIHGEVVNYTTAVNATLNCPNGNGFVLATVDNVTYTNTTACNAHSSNSQSFWVTANISGPFNNSGLTSLRLSTTSGGGDGNGGGGGGGGGGTPLNCTCGEWTNFGQGSLKNACGAGNCSEGAVLQTRTCSPASCALETQCVDNPVCSGSFNFNFTLSKNSTQIKQGEKDITRLTVSNTGDLEITLVFEADGECCDVSSPGNFSLKPKESREVPFDIHVPLSRNPGRYLVGINITANQTSFTLVKTTSVEVDVVRNQLIDQVGEIEKRLEELENLINDYRNAGISTGALEQKKDEIKEMISEAKDHVRTDSLDKLKEAVQLASQGIGEIEISILQMEILKMIMEYRWHILSGIAAVIILSYLVSQVFVPYIRLGREISALSRKEKALVKTRVETEKQYFKRVIDEKTFNKIMAEGQSSILHAKGTLKEKTEERSTLVKEKLGPKAFGSWMKGAFKRKKKKKETRHQKRGKAMMKNVLSNAGVKKRK